MQDSGGLPAPGPGTSRPPLSYTVTAGDLRPLNADNTFIKFADDMYLVIPAAKVTTRAAEIDDIVAWAAEKKTEQIKV